MKTFNTKFPAVFLLSAAVIGYEIAVMRSFAVGSWSNFGSMVISIALLGFGLAGTFLTFMQKQVKKFPDMWLALPALVLPLLMALAHVLAQQIPFNPVLISSDPVQLWWIGAYYLIYSLPFTCGALYIGAAFIIFSDKVHKLYFWNMAGSGCGGVIILGCMYLFPPDTLLLPVIILTFAAALLCYIVSDPLSNFPVIRWQYLVAGVSVLVVSVCLILFAGKIKVSELKDISYTRKLIEYKLDYYGFSPLGEMHLFESSYFHAAPGLSDNAARELSTLPGNAFKQLYIDGSGPVSIMKKLSPEAEKYIDFLPMSAPYTLLRHPSVLMTKLGGGAGIFTALHHAAEEVVCVEPNPDLVRLFREEKAVRDFNDNLLGDSRVHLITGEPRAYSAATDKRFNLVEISLIDAVGIAQTGGYPVQENFTYTAEGIQDYMRCLDTEGLLSLTVWNKLSPPRNVLRLLSSVVTALEKQGIAHPAGRIFCFQLLFQTATILVKNSDFTAAEIAGLQDFCERMSFEVCYYPGMPLRTIDFGQILAEYTAIFKKQQVVSAAQDEAATDTTGEDDNLLELLADFAEEKEAIALNPGDLYHIALVELLDGRKNELFRDYIFDIRPATDDRPYYTAYLKPGTIGLFLGQLNNIPEEWGYLLLAGTLIQSLLSGFLIIIIPMIGKGRELSGQKRKTAGVIFYYACLGLGYMLVEIYLIQRLVFFLEDPIFSLSIVITSMLVFSGLGSLFGYKLAADRTKRVRIAVAGICLALLFYIFGLNPVLNSLAGMPLPVKIPAAIVFVAFSAFFLGIPFPNGLTALEQSRKGLLPWAWGINGALSVTGSVLAKLVSVSFGYTVILVAAIFLYLTAAVVFRANTGIVEPEAARAG